MKQLHHYTELRNLDKIVKADCIDLYAKYYEEYKKDDYMWIKDRAIPLVKELCKEYNWWHDPDYLAFNPYITSYCTIRNSDYMWKEFGENGEGVILSFNEEILKQETSLIRNGSCLIPCEYIDPNSDDNHIKNKIMEIAKSDLLQDCPNDDKLMFGAIGLMQKKFFDEQELRYVRIEKKIAEIKYVDGEVKVEEYIVPNDDRIRHAIFPKEMLVGITFGKEVSKYDIEYYSEYIRRWGYTSEIVQTS